jgi:hypothetical protein
MEIESFLSTRCGSIVFDSKMLESWFWDFFFVWLEPLLRVRFIQLFLPVSACRNKTKVLRKKQTFEPLPQLSIHVYADQLDHEDFTASRDGSPDQTAPSHRAPTQNSV